MKTRVGALGLLGALVCAQEWAISGSASWSGPFGTLPVLLTPENFNVQGRAMYRPSVAVDRDFNVTFSFLITQNGQAADGLHLILRNDEADSSSSRTIDLWFDTYNNNCGRQERDSALRMSVFGQSDASLVSTPWPSCSDGQFDTTSTLVWSRGVPISATLGYIDTTRTLIVMARSGEDVAQHFTFNLNARASDVLGTSQARLQYMARTGAAASRHTVLSSSIWVATPSPSVSPSASGTRSASPTSSASSTRSSSSTLSSTATPSCTATATATPCLAANFRPFSRMDLVGSLLASLSLTASPAESAPASLPLASLQRACEEACCHERACVGFSVGTFLVVAGYENCFLYDNVTELMPSIAAASWVLHSVL